MQEIDWFSLLTVPLFLATIGWIINWTGVWMLFNPIEFRGWRIPGLRAIVDLLPRKIQQVPGIMSGGVGWQGIIPSRAAKMGSIAVDKGIAKLGSPAEFDAQLEPEKIAEHILATARDRANHAARAPAAVAQHAAAGPEVHERVQAQLPDTVRKVTEEIGANIDQLLDLKLMIFEPSRPRRLLDIKLHGLFLRRQDDAADIYAEIIADDVVTLSNIGNQLLHGPAADRTRAMIESAIRPAVDRAVGPVRSLVRAAVGTASTTRSASRWPSRPSTTRSCP